MNGDGISGQQEPLRHRATHAPYSDKTDPLAHLSAPRREIDARNALETCARLRIAGQHQRIVTRNEMLRRARKLERFTLCLDVERQAIHDRERSAGLEVRV